MTYVLFSVWFTVIHIAAYFIAGLIALKVCSSTYEGTSRVMDYHRDVTEGEEKKHVAKWIFPAQAARGLLMSIVLYPILGPLGELSLIVRILFIAGLMFIYHHLACVSPGPDNLEGLVYMRKRYIQRGSFFTFQLEMTLYPLLFAVAVSYLLF